MVDLSTGQQIFDHINRSKKILIPLGVSSSGDSLAAALAVHKFLKKLDKEPTIVSAGSIPEKYRFLPGTELVQRELEEGRSFVISIRMENAPLGEISYHQDEASGLLNIFLKPKEGQYDQRDVSFRSDKFPYDLIIVLDIPSLDLLGDLYDQHTDLFFETPVINIDHHTNNEHFGEINLVDITATSSTEILMDLLENFEAGLIDSEIATSLLAGILVETNSFQHIKTTPKAFLKASSLISMGANQQEIIKQLYKTKSVSLLKLWGRALARIREVPEMGLKYSLLKVEDMAKSGSEETERVMEELIVALPDAKIVMLFAEIALGQVKIYYQLHPNLSALDFINQFAAEMSNGHMGKFIITGKSLVEAEKEVLEKLEKIKNKTQA